MTSQPFEFTKQPSNRSTAGCTRKGAVACVLPQPSTRCGRTGRPTLRCFSAAWPARHDPQPSEKCPRPTLKPSGRPGARIAVQPPTRSSARRFRRPIGYRIRQTTGWRRALARRFCGSVGGLRRWTVSGWRSLVWGPSTESLSDGQRSGDGAGGLGASTPARRNRTPATRRWAREYRQCYGPDRPALPANARWSIPPMSWSLV